MLKIKRETDYALHIMAYLASSELPKSATQVALDCHLSVPFASKVLKILAKESILSSTRGTQGGYMLARPPSEITLLEIMIATEGPMAINACVDNDQPCDRSHSCELAPHWIAINHILNREFSNITLQTFVDAPKKSAHEHTFAIKDLLLQRED